jgi:hypothetical protein
MTSIFHVFGRHPYILFKKICQFFLGYLCFYCLIFRNFFFSAKLRTYSFWVAGIIDTLPGLLIEMGSHWLFLHGLASNHDSLYLCLLGSWDYRCAPAHLGLRILTVLFSQVLCWVIRKYFSICGLFFHSPNHDFQRVKVTNF